MEKGEVFPVEKILKKRTRYNKLEYFVKWKNYDDSHNSWEPADNFLDSEALKSFNEGSLDSREKTSKNECRSRAPIKSTTKKIRHKTQAETPKSRKRGCISPNEFIDFDETPPKAGYSAPKPTPSSNRKRPIVRGSFRTVSQASDDSVPLKHFTLENELSTSNFDETDTSRKVTTSKSYFCEKALMNRLQQLSEADQSLNEADDQDVIKSQNLSFDSTANYDQDARSFIGGLLPLTVDTQITTTIADPEPPDLQIMVSDSELWLINERNANKQKLDDLNSVCNNNNRTSSDNNSKDDIQSAPDAEIPTEGSVVTASASLALSVGDQKKNSNDVKLPILNCLDVVITDVKAHDYSVVIKECYSMPDFAVN